MHPLNANLMLSKARNYMILEQKVQGRIVRIIIIKKALTNGGLMIFIYKKSTCADFVDI